MKIIVALFAMLALSSCATSSPEGHRSEPLSATPRRTVALDGEDKIRPNCEDEWSGDWSAIAFCVESRTEGYRDVQRFVEQHDIRDGGGAPEASILAECSREWRSRYHAPDWSTIAFCVESRTEGYRDVQRFIEQYDIRDGDGTPAGDILTNCTREWRTRYNASDWSTIAFCVERQWAGYKRLHPKGMKDLPRPNQQAG
jgi:hypothetical protein